MLPLKESQKTINVSIALMVKTDTKYNGIQLVSPEDLMGSDRTYSCGKHIPYSYP